MEDTEEIFASYHLYICIITLYLCGSIASAGGIGGGGVNVPLLLVMGGYEYHEAVVFSLCTVLGNHLAQSTINWPVSHPYVKQRPLIYWDLILFLLPAQLGGSNLGVVISKAPPDILMLICAFFVLILAIAKTYHKGMMYYREERKSDSVSKYQKLANYAADCESESRNQSLLSGSLVQGSMIDQQHQQEGLSPLLSAVEEEDPAQLSVLSAKDFDFTVTENFTGDKATLEEESVQNVLYQATEEARREDQTVPSASSSSTSSVLLSVGAKQHPHLSLLPPSPPSPPHHNNLISSTTSTPLSSDPRKASTAQNHRVVYRILPYRILQILFLVFLIYVAFFLLLSYTVESCSLEYYLLLAGLYPFLIGFIYWARGFALYRQHHEPYYEVVKGDVKMEDQAIVLISLIFGVGVLSSLLGKS